MAKFVDNYFDNLEQIQNQLLDKVSKILPRLEGLSTEQKLQTIRALNFMDEMKSLGLSNAIDDLYKDFNKEITSVLQTATQLGAGVSTVNLQAIETKQEIVHKHATELTDAELLRIAAAGSARDSEEESSSKRLN